MMLFFQQAATKLSMKTVLNALKKHRSHIVSNFREVRQA